MVILNVLKTILNKVTFNGLIFFMFAIFASGLFYKYANNIEKIKMLKTELQAKEVSNIELRSKNIELAVKNEGLLNQFNTQIKKQKELSDELLQLSEEKTNCYKKVIKYNEKIILNLFFGDFAFPHHCFS